MVQPVLNFCLLIGCIISWNGTRTRPRPRIISTQIHFSHTHISFSLFYFLFWIIPAFCLYWKEINHRQNKETKNGVLTSGTNQRKCPMNSVRFGDLFDFFSLCTCWKKENTIASLKEEIPNSKNKVRRKELPFSLWITSWKQFQEIVSQTLLMKIINQLKHSLTLSTVTPHKSPVCICRKSLEGLRLPLRKTFLYIYILSQSIPTMHPNLKQIHYPA